MQIVAPKAIPSLRLLPFFYELKTVSPYLTLVMGTIQSALAWGLFQMRDWARFTATMFLSIGVVGELFLFAFHKQPTWRIVAGSTEMALRASAACYLMFPSVLNAFNTKQFDSTSLSTNTRQL